jgi:hypothetical protein
VLGRYNQKEGFKECELSEEEIAEFLKLTDPLLKLARSSNDMSTVELATASLFFIAENLSDFNEHFIACDGIS